MSYRWCRRCAQGKCSRLRHWRMRCRLCDRFKVFRGPACAPCRIDARRLVADLFSDRCST